MLALTSCPLPGDYRTRARLCGGVASLWQTIWGGLRQLQGRSLGGGHHLRANDDVGLSQRTEQRPRREQGQHRPDPEQVAPDVRFRRADLHQPLPGRIQAPGDGRHEQRAGMASPAARRVPQGEVSHQPDARYRQDVEGLCNKPCSEALHVTRRRGRHREFRTARHRCAQWSDRPRGWRGTRQDPPH